MGLQYSQIDDAVLLTQNQLVKKGAFVNMQTDLSDHVATREMWKNRKKTFEGGENWEVEYQMDHNHSARTVGLFETDGSAMHDTMKKAEVPIRHVNAHYIYDLREKAFQKGGTKIVDLVKTRYTAMMVAFFELLEELLWGKPEDSNDLKTIWGIDYWVTRNASEGFYGGDPAGFASGRGGISTDDYPRYANYTGTYENITDQDLLLKVSRCFRKTKFRSPVSHAEPNMAETKNGIYTNDTVIGEMELVLKQNNMNLGNDLMSKDGKTMIKSSPVTYVPYLDADGDDPIYFLDWSWLAVGVLAGWQNNLSKPATVPNKHNVRRVDLDASLNMACSDPRRQAVFYRA